MPIVDEHRVGPCSVCNGKGKLSYVKEEDQGGHAAYCDWCHGTGRDPLWERKREMMLDRLEKQEERDRVRL